MTKLSASFVGNSTYPAFAILSTSFTNSKTGNKTSSLFNINISSQTEKWITLKPISGKHSKGYISLVFRNIGYQIKPYNEVRESFPIEINLGISQRLQNAPINWHLTFENLQKWAIGFSNPSRITTDLDGNITEEKIGVFNELLRHVIIGAELFPKSFFNMQLGYSFRRGEELRILEQRNFSGLSFGFGIRFNKIKLNYSHSRFSTAQNINYIGLQMNLN